jgi:mannose-6-phosphate isomerase-like protein (cupin superfamily)
MNRLIDTFEELFTATAKSGGALAETAKFTLENVDWMGGLSRPEPASHPIVDRHLEAACASSGQYGSSAHMVAEALSVVTDQLSWRTRSTDREGELDLAIFSKNYTSVCIIGEGGLLPSDEVTAGFSLQGRDTYYPPHAHRAEESYWIIGGDGDWRVGTEPWFAVEPGDSIYHESGARHAMQTNEQAMLAVWLWTSHLDSKVLIVRE